MANLETTRVDPPINSIELWNALPNLVWSNPHASDEVRIAAALLNPRFQQLLTIAECFGTARLQKVWAKLLEEVPEEANRTAVYTERILTNITKGEKLSSDQVPTQNSVVRTREAATHERFKSCCIAASERHVSSDWFELYQLFTEEEYTVNDLRAVFREAQKVDQADIALLRLCMGKTLPTDPGYLHLAKDPPNLQQISEFFTNAQAANEVELARAKFAPLRGEMSQATKLQTK